MHWRPRCTPAAGRARSRPHTGRRAGLVGFVAPADAEEVDGRDAGERAGDRLDRRGEVGVVLPWDGEAVDREADQQGAEQRAEEGADDAAPEAIGQEYREVPDRDAHHGPHERGHQRGLPCLRLRGFLDLGPSSSPSGLAAGRAGAPPPGAGPEPERPPLARARRPPAGRPRVAPVLAGWRCSSIPRSRTIASNSSRDTSVGSCGAVTLRRPPRGSTGATSTGALPIATA